MLDEIIKLDNGSTIGFWKIEESAEQLLEKFCNKEPIEKQIKEFGSGKRLMEFLAVRVLLKEMLDKETEIAYDNNHKPLLPHYKLNISITHTGNV